MQPVLHFRGDAFGLIQTAVEQVHFFLTLLEEIARAFDFLVGIDGRQLFRDVAHLRGDFQKGGFKRAKIRVIAQIGQPFADRVEFGGHVKNVTAIRRMHRPVGAGDVIHVQRKFAVRCLKLHDPAVGGDEKADAHGQNGQADLRIHPCILNGLPVIVER